MRFALACLFAMNIAQGQNASFEAASVKPTRSGAPENATATCGGYGMQIDPGRFTATNVSLYKLITWAYGIRYSCGIVNSAGLLSGGPKWVMEDHFDIQAVIPKGTPAYTTQEFLDSAAPELQAMLRSLLEERFKLALHREAKQTQVYVLTAAPGGPQLRVSDPEKPKRLTFRLDRDENQETVVHVIANKASVAEFAHLIEQVTGVPVLDRAGDSADHSFDVKFAVLQPFTGELAKQYGAGATGPSIFSVLEKQLGLVMKNTRDAVDAWVIDRAEKPTAD
jgi:uncharacterized protein (TIGR03435 family)